MISLQRVNQTSNESVYGKRYKLTFVNNKDPDQHVHLHCLIKIDTVKQYYLDKLVRRTFSNCVDTNKIEQVDKLIGTALLRNANLYLFSCTCSLAARLDKIQGQVIVVTYTDRRDAVIHMFTF